jgi:Arc/MetJ family transcription regulator
MHITVDDDVVTELDKRVAPRQRSAFVVRALRSALDDERRWDDIESALGSIPDTGHDWDDDPAAWVHEQRFADPRRVG